MSRRRPWAEGGTGAREAGAEARMCKFKKTMYSRPEGNTSLTSSQARIPLSIPLYCHKGNDIVC